MRRLLGIITSAVLISGLITLAGPANAATTTFTLDDCGNTLKNRVFTVPAGDDLQVDFTTCAALRIATTNPASFNTMVIIGMTEISTFATAAAGPAPSQQRLTGFGSGPGVPLPSSQFHTIYFVNNATPGSQSAVGSFSVFVRAGGGGGGESSSGAGSAPAPVVQEFGLPASGTCDAAASEELNWAGVASGGWGVSWARWMNGGNGGPVCTRTLFYDTTAAAWAVQS